MTSADVRHVSVLHGSSFVLSSASGDMDASTYGESGFFSRDTRFVSRCSVTVDGHPPQLLSISQDDHVAAQFFLTGEKHDVFNAPQLSVARRRVVGEVWLEELVLMNHANEAVEHEIAVLVETDFADLFEVKTGATRDRTIDAAELERGVCFTYVRERFSRETRISWDAPAELELSVRDGSPGGPRPQAEIRFRARLKPHASWTTTLCIEASGSPVGSRAGPHAGSFDAEAQRLREEVLAWRSAAPSLETDWEPLRLAYERSLDDLAALRFRPHEDRPEALPAAGLPWFMALFGRDSLIASYQAVPFLPDLAAQTLRLLAELQADHRDDVRDAEPGKILHELRRGEMSVFGETPHSPYYGTADATPLFLVLLDEYERWTGDAALVKALEPQARAALAWIDERCAEHPAGFVSYHRRNSQQGLANQCWKDSWNSILFRDGSLAEPPIAPCEIQGYAFDARQRCARLAAEVWGDAALARRLLGQAESLRAAFHDHFWIEDGRYVALALDADGRRVDSRTSNMGHLLWSGLLTEDAADGVIRSLMSEELFSGWGVRTMATSDQGYNPLEYHNGTVWPHDNSLIAAGLARYDRRKESGRMTVALIRAAAAFGGRLPEVFAGYPAAVTRLPVEYPTSSSPQAWAAGAPLLLIRTLMGLEPVREHLACHPRLPPEIGRLALRELAGPWGKVDVETTHATASRRPGPGE